MDISWSSTVIIELGVVVAKILALTLFQQNTVQDCNSWRFRFFLKIVLPHMKHSIVLGLEPLGLGPRYEWESAVWDCMCRLRLSERMLLLHIMHVTCLFLPMPKLPVLYINDFNVRFGDFILPWINPWFSTSSEVHNYVPRQEVKIVDFVQWEPQSEVHYLDTYLIEMKSYYCSAWSNGCLIDFYHAIEHGDHEYIEFVDTRRVD